MRFHHSSICMLAYTDACTHTHTQMHTHTHIKTLTHEVAVICDLQHTYLPNSVWMFLATSVNSEAFKAFNTDSQFTGLLVPPLCQCMRDSKKACCTFLGLFVSAAFTCSWVTPRYVHTSCHLKELSSPHVCVNLSLMASSLSIQAAEKCKRNGSNLIL